MRRLTRWQKAGIFLVGLFGLVIGPAYAVSVLGRMELSWPDLNDTNYVTTVQNSITAISNHVVTRTYERSAIANSTTENIDHNLGIAFDDLEIRLYSGTGTSKVLVTNPTDQGWVIAADGTDPKTEVNVTTPSSGGPHTFTLVISWMKREELAKNTISLEANETIAKGQMVRYDPENPNKIRVASGYLNSHLKPIDYFELDFLHSSHVFLQPFIVGQDVFFPTASVGGSTDATIFHMMRAADGRYRVAKKPILTTLSINVTSAAVSYKKACSTKTNFGATVLYYDQAGDVGNDVLVWDPGEKTFQTKELGAINTTDVHSLGCGHFADGGSNYLAMGTSSGFFNNQNTYDISLTQSYGTYTAIATHAAYSGMDSSSQVRAWSAGIRAATQQNIMMAIKTSAGDIYVTGCGDSASVLSCDATPTSLGETTVQKLNHGVAFTKNRPGFTSAYTTRYSIIPYTITGNVAKFALVSFVDNTTQTAISTLTVNNADNPRAFYDDVTGKYILMFSDLLNSREVAFVGDTELLGYSSGGTQTTWVTVPSTLAGRAPYIIGDDEQANYFTADDTYGLFLPNGHFAVAVNFGTNNVKVFTYAIDENPESLIGVATENGSAGQNINIATFPSVSHGYTGRGTANMPAYVDTSGYVDDAVPSTNSNIKPIGTWLDSDSLWLHN